MSLYIKSFNSAVCLAIISDTKWLMIKNGNGYCDFCGSLDCHILQSDSLYYNRCAGKSKTLNNQCYRVCFNCTKELDNRVMAFIFSMLLLKYNQFQVNEDITKYIKSIYYELFKVSIGKPATPAHSRKNLKLLDKSKQMASNTIAPQKMSIRQLKRYVDYYGLKLPVGENGDKLRKIDYIKLVEQHLNNRLII